MRYQALVGITMLTCCNSAVTGKAPTPTEEFVSGCKTVVEAIDEGKSAEGFNPGFCLGIVVGMLDGLDAAGGVVNGVKRVCIPQDRDAMVIVRKIVAISVEQPELVKEAKPSVLAAIAVIQKFTCDQPQG